MKKLLCLILLLTSVNCFADVNSFWINNESQLDWWYAYPQRTVPSHNDADFQDLSILGQPISPGSTVYFFFLYCTANNQQYVDNTPTQVWIDENMGIIKVIPHCTINHVNYPISWTPGMWGQINLGNPIEDK